MLFDSYSQIKTLLLGPLIRVCAHGQYQEQGSLTAGGASFTPWASVNKCVYLNVMKYAQMGLISIQRCAEPMLTKKRLIFLNRVIRFPVFSRLSRAPWSCEQQLENLAVRHKMPLIQGLRMKCSVIEFKCFHSCSYVFSCNSHNWLYWLKICK